MLSSVAAKHEVLKLSFEMIYDNGHVIKQGVTLGKQPIVVTFTKDTSSTDVYRGTTDNHNCVCVNFQPFLYSMTGSFNRRFTKTRKNRSTEKSRERKLRHKRSVDSNKKFVKNSNSEKFTSSPPKKINETSTGKESNNTYDGSQYYFEEPQGRARKPPKKSYFSTFSVVSDLNSEQLACRRYPLYVDFEELGWSGWILSPQGYNAYHCRGSCTFPLSKHQEPNSHATVQSVMHVLGLGGQHVDLPCCTPNKLYDINLLYFDQNDYVVLQRYKDMVAGSCACR